jgi:hypothetical protein
MSYNQRPMDYFFKEIDWQASLFESITLKEMDNVKLMDRVDVKYLIPLTLLPQILIDCRGNYRILEVKNKRLCPYETLYYDTPDLDLYKAHQTGKMNRYKVRARNYVDSNLKYFEIKFKNNKGRTIKTRIRKEEILPQIDTESTNFLLNTTTLTSAEIGGVLWVDYTRMTLVNRYSQERLTIDLKLTFRDKNASKSYPEIVIAEVKQEKAKCSPFIDLMKKLHIQEGSISKYCFGMISMMDSIKKNNFKKQLQKINKLLRQYDYPSRIHVA